ncbi:hypothetical protein [Aureibacillus halotolerans]|uniref:Uncharacterized protein n=1 Tax=Aureibacillus halotolerans TaxID=1508390 RepID=A0A4R6U7C1_9BACI|nr:hypothetical protein [Aureibacillus halotolerans]TDQ40803.1 hypothetical protein EV213_105149 [Aureibacillus halotolerans]
MRTYTLQDDSYFSKKSRVMLVDEANKEIGCIQKESVEGYEKKHVFSFTWLEHEECVTLGIKKKGVSRLVKADYGVVFNDRTYQLSDRIGRNLLYFSVRGSLQAGEIRFEENWDEDVEIYIKGEKTGFIKSKKNDSKVTYDFEPSITELSVEFAVSVLMYYMVKIYRHEANVVGDLLEDLFS